MNNEMFYDPKDNKRFNVAILIILIILSFFACDKLVAQKVRYDRYNIVYVDYDNHTKSNIVVDTVIGSFIEICHYHLFSQFDRPCRYIDDPKAVKIELDMYSEYLIENINAGIHKARSKRMLLLIAQINKIL